MQSGLPNGDYDPLQICQNIVVRKPKHTVPARGKPFITAAIVPKTRFKFMTFTVDLNDQFTSVCDEVGDVPAYRTLTPKSECSQSMGL